MGFIGLLINKKNLIFFLIYLEIIYNGIMLNFLFIGYNSQSALSMVYFLIIIVLVASEAVIGLVLTILYQKSSLNISLDNLAVLNG